MRKDRKTVDLRGRLRMTRSRTVTATDWIGMNEIARSVSLYSNEPVHSLWFVELPLAFKVVAYSGRYPYFLFRP